MIYNYLKIKYNEFKTTVLTSFYVGESGTASFCRFFLDLKIQRFNCVYIIVYFKFYLRKFKTGYFYYFFAPCEDTQMSK